jgi:hypothetical protein
MISTNFPPTTSDPTQEILAQRKQECEKLLHDTKSQYEEGKGFYFFLVFNILRPILEATKFYSAIGENDLKVPKD